MRSAREALSNGVVLQSRQRPHTVQAVIAVHHGTGFRHETPDTAGAAHLMEHLLYRVPLPGGDDSISAVERSGGSVHATTHPEYTDYCSVVPPEAVADVVEWECKRLAVELDDRMVRTQKKVVAQEIAANFTSAFSAGFPWVLLSGSMFNQFHYAHNGYGDVSHMQHMTVSDLSAFYVDRYRPDRMTVTIVTPDELEPVMDRARAVLEKIPPRKQTAPRLDRTDARRRQQIASVCNGSRIRALVNGWHMPPAEFNTLAYTTAYAWVSAARRVALRQQRRQQADPHLRIRPLAGLMGTAFDVADHDVMSLAIVSSTGEHTLDQLREAKDTFVRFVDRDIDENSAAAAEAEFATALDDPRNAARRIGAHTSLFGSALGTDKVLRVLGRLDGSQVAARMGAPDAEVVVEGGRA